MLEGVEVFIGGAQSGRLCVCVCRVGWLVSARYTVGDEVQTYRRDGGMHGGNYIDNG
jgi:hypothetical protein